MWGGHILCRLKIVVTSMCAKFCLGLLVRPWPDWIVQFVHISFLGATTTGNSALLYPKAFMAQCIWSILSQVSGF